jgi:hypothetical protein
MSSHARKAAKKFAESQIQHHGTPPSAWGKNLYLKCFDGRHEKCLKHGCDCLCQHKAAAPKHESKPPEQATFTVDTIEVK